MARRRFRYSEARSIERPGLRGPSRVVPSLVTYAAQERAARSIAPETGFFKVNAGPGHRIENLAA